MEQPYTTSRELETTANSLPSAVSLADRLDPAIGEATSMMGAVVTELMRRSLRGGVMHIGHELTGYVTEQVDRVIADRTPALEEFASTVADKAARLAATEVATEEVHALESRTLESNRKLSVEIEATRQAAEQRAVEKAHETAQELKSKIQQTERRVVEKAEAQLAEEAQGLVRKIEEAEQRVQTSVRTEFSTQVQELMQRARERSERLKNRFGELENSLAEAGKNHEALRAEVATLIRANQVLAARLAELEKPRGLRALFARLFRRDKTPAAQEPTAEKAP